VVRWAGINHRAYRFYDEPVVDVTVDKDGVVTVDGLLIDGDSETSLHSALATAAEGMPVNPEEPGTPYVDAPLYVLADARASCAQVVRIFELCARDDVRIWKFIINVSCAPYDLDRRKVGWRRGALLAPLL